MVYFYPIWQIWSKKLQNSKKASFLTLYCTCVISLADNVGARDVMGARDVTIARDCKQATNKQKDKRGVTNDHDQCQNVPSQVIRRGRGVGNISIQYFDFFKALALALNQKC